jgi:hypothetical protein
MGSPGEVEARRTRAGLQRPQLLSFTDAELRARELVDVLRGPRFHGRNEAIQERIARLAVLLDELRLPAERGLLFDQAELAIDHLGAEPPSLTLFDRVVEHLEEEVRAVRLPWLTRTVLSAAPHVIVASGAVLAMGISLFVTYVLVPALPRADLTTLQVVTEAGFAGALTSLMLRFHRIRARWNLSNRDAFFEGLFRPFIGVFFAWMMYFLLDAQLLPFRPAEGASMLNLHAGLAFVTGFSERLAASVVEGLTQRAGGGGGGDAR